MSLMTIWLFVLALGAFSLVMLFGLFIARLVRDRLLARRERQREEISRALLAAALKDDAEALKPYADKDLLVAETAVRLADLVRGPERERLQAALTSYGLGPRLITRLDRGRKRQRMVAAEALSLIPGEDTVNALNGARNDKSGEVRILSIFSLLQLEEAPAIPDILDTLRSGPWSRSLLVTDLLRKLGRENQEELAAEIQREDLPAPVQVMLLDAVEGAGEFSALPQVAAQATDENPAVRGAAVRAMGRLAHPDLSPNINRALEDRSWAVRRDAVGAARKAGLHELAPSLSRRLKDEVWDVRHDAAVALSGLGQPGREALEKALAESEPPQRAEIEAALEEKQVVVEGAPGFILDYLAEPVVWIVIAFGLTQNGVYLLLYGTALLSFIMDPPAPTSPQLWRRYGEVAPPVSILAPAFNEEPTIVESVRSLLALQYGDFEVVVINDGSTDETLTRLVEAFDLMPAVRDYARVVPHKPITGLWVSHAQPKLLVIDKENGGKGDALNAGLNLARASIVCAIDADSLLERDALLRATRPFIEDPERVVAVGGAIRIANGCTVVHGQVERTGLSRNPLALIQTVEYLRAFLMGRVGWSKLGVLTIIAGAFGLFTRADLLAIGGWRRDTVGEDFELVIKLHRYLRDEKRDYRMVFIPEPVCWTEAPENLRALGRQRARWQRGLIETTIAHRAMTLNPRYGRIGFVGFSHLWLLDIVAPVVEVLGYVLAPVFWMFGLLSTEFFLAYLMLTFSFGIMVSMGAVLLEELELRRYPRPIHLLVLAAVAVLENFGYRQLHNGWRLWGAWQHITHRGGWGEMRRKGFQAEPDAAV